MAGFGLVRRSPGLAGLLAAQTISPLGDAMAMTALILHVQRSTGSATAVGLLLFAQAIPPLAAPFAGVVADRFSPGRLLGAGWLVQTVLAGLVALLLPPLGALLAVVFVLALADTPLSAAVGRCIPAVVADGDLVAANALRSGVRELASVLGPPLAGLLFAVSGARLVLGLDALTFLVVVPLALRLPAPPRDTSVRSRPSFARDARDGLAYIWRTPSVLAITVGFWVVVLFSAPDDLILPFLTTLTFRAGPVAVGVMLAAASAGLLAGLPLVRPAGRRLGATGAMVAGFAIMATGNLLTAAAPWLIAAFAAQVLRGLAIPLADTHVTTYLQRTTPPRLLGRVLANVYGGVGVAAAAGYLIGGPIVDGTSPRTAFVVVGCGGLAGAAITAVLLRRARLRRLQVTFHPAVSSSLAPGRFLDDQAGPGGVHHGRKGINMKSLKAALAALPVLAALFLLPAARAATVSSGSGSFTTTGDVISVRHADGNTIVTATEVQAITGVLNGIRRAEGIEIFHPDGTFTAHDSGTFTGTVDGRTGSLTISGASSGVGNTGSGQLVGDRGTGGLAGLHLHGTFHPVITGSTTAEGTYSVQFHFDS